MAIDKIFLLPMATPLQNTQRPTHQLAMSDQVQTIFLCPMQVLHLNKKSTGTEIDICSMLIMINLRKIRVLQVAEVEEE
jgi:hypothetical protein